MDRSIPLDGPRTQSHDATGQGGSAAGWLVCGAALAFVVLGFVFLRKGEQSEWHTCYVRAAQRMRAGEAIHRVEPVAYAYPPAMALVAVAFSWLKPAASLAAWYAVNVLATCVVFTFAWRLAGGPPLNRLGGRWLAAALLGTLLAGRFVIAPLENQQFDMVIAALLLTGCCRLWRGCDLQAGAWLGAAAAMKCTPLLFAPYLLYRRKFAAALAMLGMTLGLNLAADLAYPRSSGASYLAEWKAAFLDKVARTAPGVWDSDLVLNQSLAGLANRLVQSGLVTSSGELPSAHASLTPPQISLIRLVLLAAAAGLIALFAWTLGRPGRAAVNVAAGAQRPLAFWQIQTGLECAGICCLMLLLSPMSSKAHYVVVLPAALIFARLLIVDRSRWLPRWAAHAALAALLITGPLTSKGLVGKSLGDLTLCWGFPTWFALLLLLLLCAARGRALQAGPNPGY